MKDYCPNYDIANSNGNNSLRDIGVRIWKTCWFVVLEGEREEKNQGCLTEFEIYNMSTVF